MDEHETKKTRVLVADDDPAIRQLICTIVKRELFAVDCVADGFEAIRALEQHEYAVILVDLMMPRIDGFGVIQWLKEHPPKDKPIVLVITAYADQKFKHVDPDIVTGVIRKPFEVADLGSLIRLCVAGFDDELATNSLYLSSADPTIRELAQRPIWKVKPGDGIISRRN